MSQLSPSAPPLHRPEQRALSHDQPVPRHLVHRAAVAEVLLTDSRPAGADRFQLAAQWPRSHAFFEPDKWGRHDPMLVLETVRQAGLLLAHRHYNAPQGHLFVLREIECDVDVDALAVGSRPANLVLDAACRDVKVRDGLLRSMRLAVSFSRGGVPLATAGGAFLCLAPHQYDALRWRGLQRSVASPQPCPPRQPPSTVGRARSRDVVLGPREFTGSGSTGWRLAVDTGHPVLFDHPLDHVPGMVVLEAARQAANALHACARPPSTWTLSAAFDRFAELDRPTSLAATATLTPSLLRMEFHAHQGGETQSSGEVVVSSLSRD